MNAAQLYPGEYYAYHPQPPRGRIPIDAVKVRLRYIEQRKRSYDNNRHTMAAITFVHNEREKMVPARHIIMFWDDYKVEQDHMLQERAQREKEQRRRNLRHTVMETVINYRLTERGYPLTVSVNWGDQTATITTVSLMDWLGIEEKEIEEAINKVMEKEYGEEETGTD